MTAELQVLESTEEDLLTLESARDSQIGEALDLAGRLGSRRRRSAPLLEEAIVAELADLGMTEASVRVALQQREGWEGLRSTGLESAEFLLAANPGQPARSLARTASGGELSRVLLALKCALADAGGHETLILDEVDAGIGGRTATAVGRKIRRVEPELAGGGGDPPGSGGGPRRPQLRGRQGDRGGPARTRLCLAEGEEVVEELCRMMGGKPDDVEAMAHARELRDKAAGGS